RRKSLAVESKTIFFDIRNVLFFFHWDKLINQIADYCQINVEEAKKILENHPWKEQYEQGMVDSWFLFHQLPLSIQGSKGFAGWMEAISHIFTPNELIVPLIKHLKKNHIRLFTLSNICEAHFSYAYTHFPILHLFDGHVLSYEVQLRAPDPKFYEKGLAIAGTTKENSLYVSAAADCTKKAKELLIDVETYINPDVLQKNLQQKHYLA
ncbi:MAG: HAD hydrolase-like protein, partial [Verrucomicrobia bacterium]|nr:HAD hydrolase-like protein [Verrucomicrobiota bacterium]